MGNGIIIAAIPSQTDPVWKISSEKVPHLTMVFLGENVEPDAIVRIVEFLQHLVDGKTLYRFGLSVDKRGPLGPEDADVVFFRKDHVAKQVMTARQSMLLQPDIKRAYLSADQYPEWTPHLTLGYPAAPAKPDPNDYPISWVQFDKIALWTGDSDGPTFDLQDQWEEPLAMSEYGGVVLSHHGVKGMKWGVRKDGSTSSTTVREGGRLTRSSTDVTATQKPGQFVRTKGGAKQTASEEAIRVAAARQVAKKSTTDALSTKQLQEAVLRMNLEQQYHQLLKKQDRRTRGQRFIQSLFGLKTSSIDVGKVQQVAETIAKAKTATGS